MAMIHDTDHIPTAFLLHHQSPPKIGLINAFCSPHPSTLTIVPRGWASSGADIIGSDGNLLFQCKGHRMGSNKDILTRDSRPLYTLKRNCMSHQRAFELLAPNGATVATIQWFRNLGTTKLDVVFHNALGATQGHQATFNIRHRGFTSKEAIITCNDKDIASTKRSGAFSTEWHAKVAPGVDQSLIAALVMMLNEVRKAKARAASSGGGGGA